MTKVLEIRSYTITHGRRDEFHRLVSDVSYPLMKTWGIDVVAFGPSLHDDVSYFLIRSFPDEASRIGSQDSFYASEEWRQGPREAIVSLIESDANTVLEVDANTVTMLKAQKFGVDA